MHPILLAEINCLKMKKNSKLLCLKHNICLYAYAIADLKVLKCFLAYFFQASNISNLSAELVLAVVRTRGKHLQNPRRKRIFHATFWDCETLAPTACFSLKKCAKLWTFQKSTWFELTFIERTFGSEKPKSSALISLLLLISRFGDCFPKEETKLQRLSYHHFVKNCLFQKLQNFVCQQMLNFRPLESRPCAQVAECAQVTHLRPNSQSPCANLRRLTTQVD